MCTMQAIGCLSVTDHRRPRHIATRTMMRRTIPEPSTVQSASGSRRSWQTGFFLHQMIRKAQTESGVVPEVPVATISTFKALKRSFTSVTTRVLEKRDGAGWGVCALAGVASVGMAPVVSGNERRKARHATWLSEFREETAGATLRRSSFCGGGRRISKLRPRRRIGTYDGGAF
jgi:hypothetical protein